MLFRSGVDWEIENPILSDKDLNAPLLGARFAFGFLEIAIMGYCIAEKITTGEFPTPIFIFGILGMLIFNGIKLYETRRMTEMADEDEE